MYRQLKGYFGNVPIKLIATVLLAVLIPSLLVTALGLVAVFQADEFVKDRIRGPFEDELRRVADEAALEWGQWLEDYKLRLADAHLRPAWLARLRDEPRIRDLLISVDERLELLPARAPYPTLPSDPDHQGLREARALEASDRDPGGARARYLDLLATEERDEVLLQALLGAARTSHALNEPEAAVDHLDAALARFGETVDETGKPRKPALLCRKLEIQFELRRPEATSTARQLVSALDAGAVSRADAKFYGGRLEELVNEGLDPAVMAGVSGAARSPPLREAQLERLEKPLLDAARQARHATTGVAATVVRVHGEELAFATVAPSQEETRDELAVHLLLERAVFLEPVEWLVAGSSLFQGGIAFRSGRARLQPSKALPPTGDAESFVSVALAAPFAHLELHYLPNPGTLPSGFRSFEVITLATFTWAVIVLVLTIVVGVFYTLRSVLQEMRTARLKSDFVSFISHELKTPLAAIRMFTETLLDGRAADREEQEKCLELIDGESERLSKLIDQVIEYSKLERRQKVFTFTSCDMTDVVKEAVRLFRDYNKGVGREIEINSVQHISKIKMDRASMVELILNLLTNADKYSGPGTKIVINLRETIDDITVEVVDHGVGIRKRDQKRIFDRFFRSEDYLTREVEGTGLGLAFARYIAKVHMGEIKVSSQMNAGSTFTLQLRKTHVLAE